MAMSCSSNCMVKFDPLITRAYMWSMTERPCTWGSAPSFFDIRVDMRNITPVSGTQPAVVGSVATCSGSLIPGVASANKIFCCHRPRPASLTQSLSPIQLMCSRVTSPAICISLTSVGWTTPRRLRPCCGGRCRIIAKWPGITVTTQSVCSRS